MTTLMKDDRKKLKSNKFVSVNWWKYGPGLTLTGLTLTLEGDDGLSICNVHYSDFMNSQVDNKFFMIIKPAEN